MIIYIRIMKLPRGYKGRFRPKNPHKYKGDPTNIRWRSTWELKVFKVCDEHPDVIWWQSEELAIPYMKPLPQKKNTSRKMSRYFPDLIVHKSIGNDKAETIMIEIKPKSQTRPPNQSRKHNTPTGRVSRRYLNEAATYAVNEAKWEAAQRYCRERGWKWQIMTEDHIKPLGK